MKSFKTREKLMGCGFELCVVHNDAKQAGEWLSIGVEEIRRIEELLSEFLPGSETTRINKRQQQTVSDVNAECAALIERSIAISRLTQGCFDITVSPLKSLYSFRNTVCEFPSPSQIEKTLRSTGYQKLQLANNVLRCDNPGMRISFAAIGKGYASDQVKKLWLKNGVTSGYVNASGDLNAFGKKEDGSSWQVGIADPDNTASMLLHIPVDNASVATSGDYEQHFTNNGIRYSHTINPHTGLPLTGIKSVTVFSPGAELSDALATAAYVMGCQDGIRFINSLPLTHAIFIDDENRFHFSKSIDYEEIAA